MTFFPANTGVDRILELIDDSTGAGKIGVTMGFSNYRLPNSVTYSIEKEPRILETKKIMFEFYPEDKRNIERWIKLNHDALVGLWQVNMTGDDSAELPKFQKIIDAETSPFRQLRPKVRNDNHSPSS